MRFKKKELLFGVLLGTGLHLLESLRERLPDNVDDIKRRVRDTYDTASHRVSRATDALRGVEDSHTLGKVGALLIGVGIGVGIGVLIAPSSGEETRADITAKGSDCGDKVRQRTEKPQEATGRNRDIGE
jgi:YtxH-like protein